MLSLLTRTKSFRDPWVGHPVLNRRWQLHRHRMQLAERLCGWRRKLRRPRSARWVAATTSMALWMPNASQTNFWLFRLRRKRLYCSCPSSASPEQSSEGLPSNRSGGFDFRWRHPESLCWSDPGVHQTLHLYRDQRLNAFSRAVIGCPMSRKLDYTVHGEKPRSTEKRTATPSSGPSSSAVLRPVRFDDDLRIRPGEPPTHTRLAGSRTRSTVPLRQAPTRLFGSLGSENRI